MSHIVVVGGGIAGLVTALHAAERRHTVTLVTKAELSESNTRYAQGGIAAAMAAPDTVRSHLADTIAAGAGLTDEHAAGILCADGPERMRELIEWGVPFDRTNGALDLGREAAHSVARVLHAGGDSTGLAVQTTLCDRVRRQGVTILEKHSLVDLVMHNGAVTGAILVTTDGGLLELTADAVALATGGAGQLFSHTTNPGVAAGDGLAAAMRAGAQVADLEFYQFHPTTMLGSGFLISEAVRGEGAVLRDAAGHRFMVDEHPLAELAPRDVVARAIVRATVAHAGSPVVLDATHLGREYLSRRFPSIDRAVREAGIDWATEGVPITPAAHYAMGGVVTDTSGRTSLPGLFAVGEVARTGVHGANRLASNSLLEGAVFGARAAAALDAPSSTWPAPARAVTDLSGLSDLSDLSGRPSVTEHNLSAPAFSRSALQKLMWTSVGLLREASGLREALGVLDDWASGCRPADGIRGHEDQNLLDIARATTALALARTESRGAHARLDYPHVDPAQAVPRIAQRRRPAVQSTPDTDITHVMRGDRAAEHRLDPSISRDPAISRTEALV